MRRLLGRFSTRLFLGVVLAFLPLATLLAVLLVRNASDSLERSIGTGLQNTAQTAGIRVDTRFFERRADLRQIARSIRGRDGASLGALLRRDRGEFEALQVVDLRGRVLAGSDRSGPLADRSSERFATAARGGEAFTQPFLAEGTLRTLLLEPVLDAAGEPRYVLVGDLDETVFASFLLGLDLGRTGEAVVRDRAGRLVWRTRLGRPRSPREMAARGALRDVDTDGAPGRALRGEVGFTQFKASTGNEALGGYAPARRPGWAVDVRQDTDEAFDPIDEQRTLALLVGLLGALLVGAFAIVFANRAVRPVRALGDTARQVADGDLRVRASESGGPDEVRELSRSFNLMIESLERLAGQIRGAGAEMATSSAELSSAAQELAATTNQQSSAATETSTTMEELATTSARIAEAVEQVAQRTVDTQGTLERADEGLTRSSERTRALAGRSVEIGQIVVLINEIADRTNLLALNAAIEAARAGEAGAGFAVVAEEVRLLAERSKNEAAKIGEIVSATQAETNATVMAMEGGSQEMRRGLQLMEQVADSTSEVRLSTDQQRVATDQVVETMTSVSSATKQTASTASQIATAATGIADLAEQLNTIASAFVTRGTAGAPRVPAGAAAPPPPAAGGPGANGAVDHDPPRDGPPEGGSFALRRGDGAGGAR